MLSPSELKGDRYRLVWFEAPADPRRDSWRAHVVVLDIETVCHFAGAADFHGDSRVDIAYAQMPQGTDPDNVNVLLNRGRKSGAEWIDAWEPLTISEVGSHSMRILDADRDGHPDLVGANWSAQGRDEQVKLWLNRLQTGQRASNAVVQNDVAWRDTAGNEIWCNGGHIVREGDVFYWVGYDTGPSRWPWHINLYSSRNLAGWKLENTVIHMEGQFARMGWAGRPALLHCPATGDYVIVFEADSPSQWQRHRVGFAVCDRIAGEYELAGTLSPEGTRSTGDQSVYQENGKAYVLATIDRDIDGKKYLNQSLAIFELSSDFLRTERKVFEGFDNVTGNSSVVPREHSKREASHIIKVGGIYYWFSSGLVGWNSSATMYATPPETSPDHGQS